MIKLNHRFLVLVVFIVAFLLRFWNFLSLPFAYDELSTIFRISSDDWFVVWEWIKKDSHPPGHHLVMMFMREVFGSKEWIIKLPFILAGWGSIVLTYKVSACWINKNAGLLAASVLTVSQYHIMHSQTARPYSLALFFVLLVFYFLIKYTETQTDKKKWVLGLFIALSISCTAYLHYLALLSSVVIWSLFFLSQKNKKEISFLTIPIVSLLLCAPLYEFFIAQWAHKGLSQILGVQGPEYIFHFLWRIVNFSWPFLLAIGISLGLIYDKNRELIKQRRTVLLVFTITLLIIWVYSIFRAPLLNDRALFFVLPFLLLFIFSFVKKDHSKFVEFAVGIILMSGSVSLIFSREHYTQFYNQGFDNVAKLAIKNIDQNQLSIINYNPETYQWIIDKHPDFNDLNVLNPDSTLQMIDYLSEIKNPKYNSIQLANTAEFFPFPLELIAASSDRFPNQRVSENYHLSFFRMNQKEGNNDETNRKEYKLDLAKGGNYWKTVSNRIESDNNPSISYLNEEWGIEFNANLNDIIQHKSDYLFIKCEVEYSQIPYAYLSLEIRDENEVIISKINPFSDYLFTDENTGVVYAALDLSDIDLTEKLTVKAFVWNRGKKAFWLTSAKVWSEPGNPYKFSLVKKF